MARRQRRQSQRLRSLSGLAGDLTFALRSLLRAPTFALVAAAAVAIGVGSIPVQDVVGYQALSRFSVARDRFLATLTGVFAALALLLSLVGTYGALAYAVRRRSRELAIRMALGAGRGRMAREVFARAARLVGGGVVGGIAGALLLTRFMGSVLYEVSPLDPMALGGAVILLGFVGLVGAWVPAHRAARTDPMRTLRE